MPKGQNTGLLYVRTKLRPLALVEPVLKIFAVLDPTLPVTNDRLAQHQGAGRASLCQKTLASQPLILWEEN